MERRECVLGHGLPWAPTHRGPVPPVPRGKGTSLVSCSTRWTPSTGITPPGPAAHRPTGAQAVPGHRQRPKAR